MKDKLTNWDKVQRWLYWLKFKLIHTIHPLGVSQPNQPQTWLAWVEELSTQSREIYEADAILWTVGTGLFKNWRIGAEFIRYSEDDEP